MTEDEKKLIDEMRADIKALTATMTEYVTVTRRHISQQEATNSHLQRIVDDHDKRIRSLEEHRAVMAATLPKKWLDAEVIERAIETQALSLDATNSRIDKINVQLAKWAGIAAAIITIGNWIGPVAFKALAGIFGGN